MGQIIEDLCVSVHGNNRVAVFERTATRYATRYQSSRVRCGEGDRYGGNMDERMAMEEGAHEVRGVARNDGVAVTLR